MQEKTTKFQDFFYTTARIKASFEDYFHQRKSLKIQVSSLDTVGTTGSESLLKASLTAGIQEKAVGAFRRKTKSAEGWEKQLQARRRVKNQLEEIQEALEQKDSYSAGFLLNKAASALQGCGKNYLVEKIKAGKYKYLHSFHCKKKYCPRCSVEKRNVLLARFQEFFEEVGPDAIQEKYDLAILTVTLKHGAGSRTGWYFKELQTHFRNSLKYGAFKKYLAGGVYSTEVTWSDKNGFHIHRHALVLIPKEYNFRAGSVGSWIQSENKYKFVFSNPFIKDEIKKAWYQKTGDSFQVDLTPVNDNQTFIKNALEIFKYIAKPNINKTDKGSHYSIPYQIVEAIEGNKGQKFLGRFGVLYWEKRLALNVKFDPDENENIIPGDKQLPNPDRIYFAKGLYKTKKGKYAFQVLFKATAEDLKTSLDGFSKFCLADRKKFFSNLHNKSFRRFYGIADPVPKAVQQSDAVFQNAGTGQCPLFSSGFL